MQLEKSFLYICVLFVYALGFACIGLPWYVIVISAAFSIITQREIVGRKRSGYIWKPEILEWALNKTRIIKFALREEAIYGVI